MLCVCVCVCCVDEGGRKRRKKPSDKTRSGSTKETPAQSDNEQKDACRDDDAMANTTNSRCHRETLQDRIVSSPLSEDYLKWKETMLTRARAKLQAITTQ